MAALFAAATRTARAAKPALAALLIAVPLALAPGAACKRTTEPAAATAATAAIGPELWREFSGDNALAHVRELVAFGPRPAGSPALAQTREYLEARLAAAGWRCERQTFTEPTPRGPVGFVNVVARFPGDGSAGSTPRAIVASHYDTKRFDGFRFVGANDAGSSTGALLELARVLAMAPPLARQIELVFFDGEECLAAYGPADGLHGSRHYARALAAVGRPRQWRFGVLWDMIGDAELRITLPADSPPWLVRALFESAAAVGTRRHFTFGGGPVLDDHVPLNEAGVPTIDLIDFEYPPWHTAADTVDRLSADSLQAIGATTVHLLQRQLDGGDGRGVSR